tara:strand:+ start:1006 stop:1725 length:720 start_codon:yes stop_codon:yes gene_type:complete
MVIDLLKDLNKDDSFVDSINESSYTEKINNSENSIENKYYSNFVSCILSEYDPIYGTIPTEEKSMYMNKLIIEICSQIDEKPECNYYNYQFNKKVMKPSIIQYGLQNNKINYISSIYYLNEYYKKHFIIVFDNKIYETCLKNYPKVYLKYSMGKVMINETNNIKDIKDIKDIFNKINLKNDIKKDIKSIYQMKLNPISKYKVDDLKKLAQECNISLKDGSKNKTKQVLYDEINLYKLNN